MKTFAAGSCFNSPLEFEYSSFSIPGRITQTSTMSSDSDNTGCGKIRELSRSESGVAFEWTPITRRYLLSNDKNEPCTSPRITAMEGSWFLELVLNGYHYWIDLFIYRFGPLKREVFFSIHAKLAGKTEVEIVSSQLFPPLKLLHYGIVSLLPRSMLQKRRSIHPKDQLTFTCKLWTTERPILEGGGFFTTESTADNLTVRSAKGKKRSHHSEGSTPSHSDRKLIKKEFVFRETQTEEQSNITAREESVANLDTKVDSTLQKHLKDFLLTGDDHDVTIKVGDQEFRAHKGMLRARSPVFASMFKRQMKESEDGSITIDDIDPNAFGEFLNYVYTGKVEDLSPRKATGLYYAGEKYDFSGLKELCVQFLEASLSKTCICDVIILATSHGEKGLLESAIKFFTENTKEILITVEWQRFAVNNFVAANELIIKAFDAIEKTK